MRRLHTRKFHSVIRARHLERNISNLGSCADVSRTDSSVRSLLRRLLNHRLPEPFTALFLAESIREVWNGACDGLRSIRLTSLVYLRPRKLRLRLRSLGRSRFRSPRPHSLRLRSSRARPSRPPSRTSRPPRRLRSPRPRSSRLRSL